MNKKKEFDCVELKHAIQEEIYEETKDMTQEEEREYLRKNLEKGPLGKKWKELQEQKERAKKAS